jgi:hypothetical protein
MSISTVGDKPHLTSISEVDEDNYKLNEEYYELLNEYKEANLTAPKLTEDEVKKIHKRQTYLQVESQVAKLFNNVDNTINYKQNMLKCEISTIPFNCSFCNGSILKKEEAFINYGCKHFYHYRCLNMAITQDNFNISKNIYNPENKHKLNFILLLLGNQYVDKEFEYLKDIKNFFICPEISCITRYNTYISDFNDIYSKLKHIYNTYYKSSSSNIRSDTSLSSNNKEIFNDMIRLLDTMLKYTIKYTDDRLFCCKISSEAIFHKLPRGGYRRKITRRRKYITKKQKRITKSKSINKTK